MYELDEHFAVPIEEDFIAEDILYEIVSFLPAKDLFVAEKVSVTWANACAHIKWIRVLPEWKMKKLHPDATYDEKREYAKKEMKEFVVEKNATKLHANITQKITAANKYLREIHPIVDVYTFYTSTALVSILIALLAMDIKTWTNTIIWLVALCSAASFVCSRALLHHLNIPDVIMLVALGTSSSVFSVWVCIKALEGSVLAWIFILLVSSGLTFFSSSLPKRIANGFYLTTLFLFMLFCCGYMGYLWFLLLQLMPTTCIPC
jgi:hypothetical protein